MFKVNGSEFTTRIREASVACPSCHLCHINMTTTRLCVSTVVPNPWLLDEQPGKKTMSVKKSLSLTKAEEAKRPRRHDSARKRRSFDLCFSSPELPLERGKSLKEMDSEKLKTGIRKWAKAVVAYARQVSDRFGSWRR